MPAEVVLAAEEMRSHVGQGHTQGQDPHNLPPTGELRVSLALRCCHLASFAFLSQRYTTTSAVLCLSKLSIFFKSAY